MGKGQFNLRIDEELIKRIQEEARKQGKTVTQLTVEALNLSLGTPVKEQIELSLEAIDERIEANLDYKLLDIRDSLATNLDSKLAEKLADIEKRVDHLKFEYLDSLDQVQKEIATLHSHTKAIVSGKYENSLEQILDAKLASFVERMDGLEAKIQIVLEAQEFELESCYPVISQRKLATRLQVSPETVKRHTEKSDFTDWTRPLDPDGLGWKFNGKKYYAVT